MRVIKWLFRTIFSFVYAIVGAVIITRGIQALNDFIDRTKMKRQNNKSKSNLKKK